MLLPGRGDLMIALRPLHEDHLAPRNQAFGDPLQRLRDRPHGAGDDPLHPTWIIRPDLSRINLDALQPELGADLAQKLGPSSSRLGQNHLNFGSSDLEWDSGQARSRAHVDERGGQLDKVEDQQAVHIMLENHVLEVVNSRQVEARVGGSEPLVIAPEEIHLVRCQDDAATIQDRQQGISAGLQERLPE